ncbi:MAG: choice-of-anchor B family protein [Flavobacteriaceae bacterium]
MKKITLLILFLTVSVFSQTPCESGFAGEYPCNDYDLLSHIPVATLANTNGNPEGSDIWGWTDATTGKEYAILAMTNSTAFVDVSDPINPVFLGRLNSNAGNNFWRDVKIYKDYAFIVADNVGAHGMQVFNLTKLRGVTSSNNTFTADKVYTGVGSCHNIFINENTAIAYLVGCGNYSGGPNFVDISDPENPVGLGGYSTEGYTHDAQAVTYSGPDTRYTGKEIFIGSNATKIVILDVTDKNNIQKISDIDYAQLGYTHQGWFTEDQRYFILGDELDERDIGLNTRTLIFDFNNLENPQLSSTYSANFTAIDHNGYVLGNKYYMANYRAGLRVFDISNISSTTNPMTEIGYFDTFPSNNGVGFNGAWSVYPYFASGNIIINDIERGLFVVRKSGTLGVNDLKKQNNFYISPNPLKTQTTINAASNQSIKSIKVYSVLGKKVIDKKNIDQSKYVLKTNKLQKGIYLVRINNNITKKIVVQ